jgi:hypothetical protein
MEFALFSQEEENVSGLLDELWSSSDLVVIVGDQDRTIGNGHPCLAARFRIEVTGAGVEGPKIAGAVLTLMVRGLTAAGQQPVVKINHRPVGVLPPYPGADRRHWFSEAIGVGAGVLQEGENEIEIRAAGLPDPPPGDVPAGFQIRDLICHYQVANSGR